LLSSRSKPRYPPAWISCHITFLSKIRSILALSSEISNFLACPATAQPTPRRVTRDLSFLRKQESTSRTFLRLIFCRSLFLVRYSIFFTVILSPAEESILIGHCERGAAERGNLSLSSINRQSKDRKFLSRYRTNAEYKKHSRLGDGMRIENGAGHNKDRRS